MATEGTVSLFLASKYRYTLAVPSLTTMPCLEMAITVDSGITTFVPSLAAMVWATVPVTVSAGWSEPSVNASM